MITSNLHTHTERCKHAVGNIDDYCRAAVAQGLTVLGISDHTPLPDNRWLNVRMDIADLPDYCREMDNARAKFPGLTILKAAECEYAPEYAAFYRDELLGRREFDYLICGAHSFQHNGKWTSVFGGTDTPATLQSYARCLVESMESGLFAFIAHPDVFSAAYLEWDTHAIACSREIFRAAETLKIPLEINAYGLRDQRMYPWDPFWKLAAEYGIDVVVTSDAHRPEDVTAAMDEAAAIGRRYGLRFADLSRLEKSGADATRTTP